MNTAHSSAGARDSSTFFFMNVLRAYASVMVVLFHANSIAQSINPVGADTHFASPLWWHSVIDLFFVMSGFLMVHMSRKLYGSWAGAAKFATKRLVRTPPLYWLYTLVTAAIFLILADSTRIGVITLDRIVASLFFFPIPGGPIILLGWTLNLEVFFYTIFGLTVRLPFPTGAFACSAILVALVAIGLTFNIDIYALRIWTDPILLDFIWGIGLAVLFHSGVRLSQATRAALLVGSIAILAVVTLTHFDRLLAPFNLLRPIIFGGSAALLVAAATLRERDGEFGMAGNFITQLSNAAYTVYLSHIISLKAVEVVYRHLGLADRFGPSLFMIVAVPVAVGLGYVAYLLIEKPLDGYLRGKVFGSKRLVAAPTM
jgi:exopolysaccharide production protein ExoZ